MLGVIRSLGRERIGKVEIVQPREGESVLELADRMGRMGGGSPATLYGACVAALRRGEVGFDDVTRLYRHACLHARIVVPVGRERLHVCPVCEAELGGAN